MKFRTPYTKMKTVFSNPGQRMKVVYELKIDQKGKRGIEKVGTTDVQAAIDSEFASVDFNLVLRRLENGDTDALERAQAFYADVSDLPVNLRDLMELNEQGTKIFANMPEEYKRLYGNDYMKFLYDPGKLIDEVAKKNKLVEVTEVHEEVVKSDDPQQQ